MSVGPLSKKFNIVSNNHGRTQRCDFYASIGKINFTDHHTPYAINDFKDPVVVCKMHDCYRTIRKNLEHFHSFSSCHQAMQAIAMVRLIYEKKAVQNVFKRIYHCIYLLKLYNISVILLLKNNLTNICSKISKIGMNLWMVYFDRNHERSGVVLDHFRYFKGI